jgi:hypothetical protein
MKQLRRRRDRAIPENTQGWLCAAQLGSTCTQLHRQRAHNIRNGGGERKCADVGPSGSGQRWAKCAGLLSALSEKSPDSEPSALVGRRHCCISSRRTGDGVPTLPCDTPLAETARALGSRAAAAAD